MSDIDIRLHIEFDGDTYIKQMSSLDSKLQQLHSLGGYGKRLKVGGRQKVSKKYIQEFPVSNETCFHILPENGHTFEIML